MTRLHATDTAACSVPLFSQRVQQSLKVAVKGLVCSAASTCAVLLLPLAVMADGPADNNPQTVRRIPKEGVDVPADREAAMRGQLVSLQDKLKRLGQAKVPSVQALLPDIMIFERAVRVALDHKEFFDIKELDRGDALLTEGISRADELLAGHPTWHTKPGLVARGYISRIDNTVQPYGLVIPETYAFNNSVPTRCDLWFHGRGETLSEVNFIWDRMKNRGQFAPDHTIVLHPYGRYSNANKFAGEVDVLEALEDAQKRYRIDEDRISVRGFSMGGAACWQLATHYSDRWFAANPGAGFSETPRFLDVFQDEDLQPKPWERTLWSLYDCDKWALNLAHCPTIAYSGEVDRQKQAADVMEEALAGHGIQLRHIIGAEMGHRYDDVSKQIVEQSLSSLAAQGRNSAIDAVSLSTHTLKYNRMHWLTVDGIAEHWQPAVIRAKVMSGNIRNGNLVIEVASQNVTAFSFDFPAGTFPLHQHATPGTKLLGVNVHIGPLRSPGPQQNSAPTIKFRPPYSDGSLRLSVHQTEDGQWHEGAAPDGLSKRHNLQGPIDDAFMDSFVFVRPTGRSANEAAGKWANSEMERAIEHWRRHFRGDARVVNDTDVTEELAQQAHLILWGDPSSNSVMGKITDQLPIGWNDDSITVGNASYPSANHAPILIYPNPLNPNRYVVLNSSFTFREYAYLNNARQVPMLPDWAIINLDTPPGSVWPGDVVAADFFDEHWKLKVEKSEQ